MTGTIDPFKQDQTQAYFAANDEIVKSPNSYLHKIAAFHVRFVKIMGEQIPMD